MWASFGIVLGFGRKPFTPEAAMAPASQSQLGVPLDADDITGRMYREARQTLAMHKKLVDAGRMTAEEYNAKVDKLQASIRRCEMYPVGARQQALLAAELTCREREKQRRGNTRYSGAPASMPL